MTLVAGQAESSEASEGAWLESKARWSDRRSVGSLVPEGYAAYARLLHPAEARQSSVSSPVRWREIARWSGSRLTSTTGFMGIALPRAKTELPPPWRSGPAKGSMTTGDARALVTVLRGHTTTPHRCWFCVWEGYGWLNTHDSDLPGLSVPPDQRAPSILASPKATVNGRGYFLFQGDAQLALSLSERVRQTPNIWWPMDRSWCVVSDVDLDCTYVGGTADAIEAILSDIDLEVLPARLTDRRQTPPSGPYRQYLRRMTVSLLASGSAKLSTPIGGLEARLRGEGRGQSITVEWTGPDGAWSGQLSATLGAAGVARSTAYLAQGLEALARGN